MGEYAVSAGTYGIDMSIGNIVAADNTLYITVPIVFKDKIYSIDLSNLGKDFNNSAWSELLGENFRRTMHSRCLKVPAQRQISRMPERTANCTRL